MANRKRCGKHLDSGAILQIHIKIKVNLIGEHIKENAQYDYNRSCVH